MKRLRTLEAGFAPASHATPITPADIETDDRLTDEQKARIYDDLFEYHGDEDDDGCDD